MNFSDRRGHGVQLHLAFGSIRGNTRLSLVQLLFGRSLQPPIRLFVIGAATGVYLIAMIYLPQPESRPDYKRPFRLICLISSALLCADHDSGHATAIESQRLSHDTDDSILHATVSPASYAHQN